MNPSLMPIESFAISHQEEGFATFKDILCVSHHSWPSNIRLLYYITRSNAESLREKFWCFDYLSFLLLFYLMPL